MGTHISKADLRHTLVRRKSYLLQSNQRYKDTRGTGKPRVRSMSFRLDSERRPGFTDDLQDSRDVLGISDFDNTRRSLRGRSHEMGCIIDKVGDRGHRRIINSAINAACYLLADLSI